MSWPTSSRHVTTTVLVLVLVVALDAACSKRGTAPADSWEPSRSCSSNDDCRPAPSCCPAPCSSDVINRSDMDKAQLRVNAHCSEADRAQCPQAGSCAGHLYACVRSRCALVMEGSPDWPKSDEDASPKVAPSAGADAASVATADAKAAAPWDVSCKKDDDCVTVRAGGGGCCPSPCPAGVVNKRDQDRVEADLREACKREAPGPCMSVGGCRGHEILCVRSKCAIVYEGEPDYRKRSK